MNPNDFTNSQKAMFNQCKCKQAVILSRDLPVRGTMSKSDFNDYVIDLNALSADEFIKKHC